MFGPIKEKDSWRRQKNRELNELYGHCFGGETNQVQLDGTYNKNGGKA